MRRWPQLVGESSNKQKRIMVFVQRAFLAALCVAVLSFTALPAFAQSGPRPADQSSATPDGKNGQKTDELAEAAAALPGPAGNAECVWLGRRVVIWMWQDDLDTAFRHLDLYDRFGCPAAHVQATYRCLIQQGPFDNKSPETLNARVHACWIKPPPAAAQVAPAPTTANPARR
jgi:hypothetical protein